MMGMELTNKEQKKLCIYAKKHIGVNCLALTEYICDTRQCSFFKSTTEWELDNDGIPVRKEDRLYV